MPNPAKFLRERKQKEERQAEAVETLSVRLKDAFSPKNREEQKKFVEKLKEQSISAQDLYRLSEEIGKGVSAFIRWETGNSRAYNARSLADVLPRTRFSKILIIIRDLHADDVAGDVPFEKAAKLVIDEVLLRN